MHQTPKGHFSSFILFYLFTNDKGRLVPLTCHIVHQTLKSLDKWISHRPIGKRQRIKKYRRGLTFSAHQHLKIRPEKRKDRGKRNGI